MLTKELSEVRNLSAEVRDVSTGVDRRNQNLDALRGIAILLVLGHHAPYFSPWGNFGWAGVDLFFVLSGFLVSGLLYSQWKKRGKLNLPLFYLRRTFKIWPPLYVFLGFFVLPVLLYNRERAGQVLRSLAVIVTFTSNYLPQYCMATYSHLWSLAVEEHFYIALPVLLWVLQRRGKRCDPFRPILFILPPLAIIDASLRVFAAARCGVEHDCDTFSFATHLRLDELMFGVMLGYLRHFRPVDFQQIAESRSLLVFAAVAIASTAMLSSGDPVSHAVAITLAYLGLGCLLPITIDRDCPVQLRWIHRLLATIGVYSYSIYLWHPLTVSFVPHRTIWGFLFYLASSVALGAVTARLFETPFLRLRERLYPSDARSATQACLRPSPPESRRGAFYFVRILNCYRRAALENGFRTMERKQQR